MVFISRRAALFIMQRAAELFRICAGIPVSETYEYDVEWNADGLIEDISEEDVALRYWMNSVMVLTRTIVGIISRAIEEEDAAEGLLSIPTTIED